MSWSLTLPSTLVDVVVVVPSALVVVVVVIEATVFPRVLYISSVDDHASFGAADLSYHVSVVKSYLQNLKPVY